MSNAPRSPFFRLTPQRTFVLILLLILIAQCLNFALHTGQTTDETFYSGSGYPIVRYNNYEFLGEHPPFIIQLGALPLLLIQPKFPIENPFYVPNTDRLDLARNGAVFLYKMGNDPDLILFLERLPIILLTALLGFGIFVLGREMYGEWGALLALFLYVFMPDIIGNGSLYTTDMGLTVFYFFSVYALKKFFEQPDLKHVIALGICCGLTFMSKISGLILFPIAIFLFLLFYFTDPRAMTLGPMPATSDRRFGILTIFLLINAIAQKQAMVILGPIFLLAFYLCFKKEKIFSSTRFMPWVLQGLVIAGYVLSFIFVFRLKRKYAIEASAVFILWNAVAALFTFLLIRFWNRESITRFIKLFLSVWLIAALVIILDYTDFFYKFYRFIGFGNYVKPLGIVLSHSLGGHRGCLEGSFITCDWRYFGGVLAVKTPLLVLGLSLLGFFLLLGSRVKVLGKMILIAPVFFFLLAAVANKIHLGLRHILPVFPFLFLLSGFSGAAIANMKRGFLKVFFAGGLLLLLALFAFRTLRTAPYYLTYFNEFIGGVEEGAKLMPVNWGQDNRNLARFVLKEKLPAVKIASEASNPDIYDYYKIPWTWMQESDFLKPEPGFYALGIGVYKNLQKNPLSWFKNRQPNYRIGRTIYIFEVPPSK